MELSILQVAQDVQAHTNSRRRRSIDFLEDLSEQQLEEVCM
jgi:hypothetical protein